jgi:U3 small nucleolar RNA-associated protein 16
VSAAPTRKRLDKRSLPDVLPDEFLETASDDDDDDDEQDASKSKKPKSNTLLRQMAKAESRRPRDQRVGSTVYRVTRPQEDRSLAPKAHRHSQNAKEVLLRRQRPVARKGGFLVRKRR